MRVVEQPEPPDFDEKVRQPGLRALREMLGNGFPRRGRPRRVRVPDIAQLRSQDDPELWQRISEQLYASYSELCSFSMLWIPPATGARSVDHFLPKSSNGWLAYEWSNYRLCCSLVNGFKADLTNVIDPFDVVDGSFELELVAFQIRAAPRLEAALERHITQTPADLRLNDARLCRPREHYATAYSQGEISYSYLATHAPFVASELHRQGGLHSGDKSAQG